MAAPMLAVIALVIKLDSAGPGLYCAPRVGRKGKRFICYKFRTMVTDADKRKEGLRGHNEREGPFFKIANDPRVTRVGRLLRRYSLDELPQLWNVLKGDMSLVGPRPIRPAFFGELCQAIPEYWQRLVVRPGVTGLAQLRLTREMTWAEKLAHDLEYIADRSLRLYVSVITTTVWLIVVRPANRRASLNKLP